jgi:hypothetical protein
MCVFDVATTGDPTFAKHYLIGQNLRLHSTRVQVVGDSYETQVGQPLVVTATVTALFTGRPPTGHVTFVIDGVATGTPVRLDTQGRASFTVTNLSVGDHKIRATFAPDKSSFPSESGSFLHRVVQRKPCPPPGTTCPPSLGGRIAARLRTCLDRCCPGVVKRLIDCLEHLKPCSCGGAHSQADHPHDDHAHGDHAHGDHPHAPPTTGTPPVDGGGGHHH